VNRGGGTSNVTTSADCAAVFNGVLQGGAPSITSVAALANVVGSVSDFTAVVNAPNCAYYYTAQSSASGQTVPVLTYVSATGLLTQGTQVLP
jgi:hypothetical protein